MGVTVIDHRTGDLKYEYHAATLTKHTCPNPVAFVRSQNRHRRHLSDEELQEMIREESKAHPEKSSRQIAKEIGASKTTVEKHRLNGHAGHSVERVEATGLKARGRKPGSRAKIERTEAKPLSPVPDEVREKAIATKEPPKTGTVVADYIDPRIVDARTTINALVALSTQFRAGSDFHVLQENIGHLDPNQLENLARWIKDLAATLRQRRKTATGERRKISARSSNAK